MIFDLATFTFKFDLLMKNFHSGHNFWIRRDIAFLFHMRIPWDETLHTVLLFILLSTLDLAGWPTLPQKCHGIWLLNQRGYLLLLFSYGCRRRAMLSFWQLWYLNFCTREIQNEWTNSLSYPTVQIGHYNILKTFRTIHIINKYQKMLKPPISYKFMFCFYVDF